MLQTALHFSHSLLKEVVHDNDIVVDATMGNGNDTVFLANLVGENGHVFAFDVQKQAIENTKLTLTDLDLLKRTTLIQNGHEFVDSIIPEETVIKAAIFNLGYLPKSDKTIITKADTTLQALTKLLEHLCPHGRIILVVYFGHDGGKEELEAIQEFCIKLSQIEYNVLTYQFINQKNNPPILYCIEKK